MRVTKVEEYPAVALALDAEMEAVSPNGRRQIPASDFFVGLWETTLEPDEVLAGVRFPVWQGRCGFGLVEFARRHGDFAIAGAVIAVELDGDDRVSRCGIGLMGLSSTPRRASAAEAAVVGQPVATVPPEQIGELAMNGLDDIPADLQGSASYRIRVGAAMVARAWVSATAEALNA
jgi:aerobic carbon-monoxide dehydrogenase medium subunit